MNEKTHIRYEGIDAFRLFGFMAVVILHTMPATLSEPSLVSIIKCSARFAVPLFFIVSGHFMGLKPAPFLQTTRKILFRLAPVYVFWLSFYLIYTGSYKDIFSPQLPKMPLEIFLNGGLAFHLWFLPILALSGILVRALAEWGPLAILGVGGVMYIVALALGAYGPLYHLPYLHWQCYQFRACSLMGVLFVGLGYVIADRKIHLSLKASGMMALSGLFLLIAETALIYHESERLDYQHDAMIGTVPFAMGLFFLALNWNGGAVLERLAPIGRLSLGAYCVHLYFVMVMKPYLHAGGLLDNISIAIGIVFASLLVSFAMSKIPYVSAVVK
jgi:surface polysaccharide O-acyltransferase-like enzyme